MENRSLAGSEFERDGWRPLQSADPVQSTQPGDPDRAKQQPELLPFYIASSASNLSVRAAELRFRRLCTLRGSLPAAGVRFLCPNLTSWNCGALRMDGLEE